jgi:steroid delta-isomerase-like uncharacterized protein
MKRLIVLLPLSLLIMFSCQNKETLAELDEVKAQVELEKQNLALIGKYIEAWNTKKIIVIDEFLDSDFQAYIPSNSEASMSLVEFKDWIEVLMQAFPDMHWDIQDIFAYKDKVCLRWTCTATYLGDDPDNSATGKQIFGSAIEIFKVENGKIMEERSEVDALGWNLQLGMELKMKE